MKYRNLWFDLGAIRRPEYFEHNGRKVGEWRGVEVFHNPAGSYDYVYEGAAISQRAGYEADTGAIITNAILDGFACVSDPVAEHLRQHGHNPLSYADASAIDACERDGFPVPARGSEEFAAMVQHYAGKK